MVASIVSFSVQTETRGGNSEPLGREVSLGLGVQNQSLVAPLPRAGGLDNGKRGFTPFPYINV